MLVYEEEKQLFVFRKIDFVLVYEEEKQSHENPGFSADDLEDPNNVNQTNNDTSQK